MTHPISSRLVLAAVAALVHAAPTHADEDPRLRIVALSVIGCSYKAKGVAGFDVGGHVDLDQGTRVFMLLDVPGCRIVGLSGGSSALRLSDDTGKLLASERRTIPYRFTTPLGLRRTARTAMAEEEQTEKPSAAPAARREPVSGHGVEVGWSGPKSGPTWR